jgi:hypothetical protein
MSTFGDIVHVIDGVRLARCRVTRVKLTEYQAEQLYDETTVLPSRVSRLKYIEHARAGDCSIFDARIVII